MADPVKPGPRIAESATAPDPEVPAGHRDAGHRDTGPAHPVAPYAAHAGESAGRVHPEAGCPMRTCYQRDRDRIIHATAFRRLTYKTQVFLFHEGDHYRTRLTHSLEVAQIARAIARMLALDEDLAEALALAHDLGHPPFGHAGERALAEAMAPYGGFDHNAQSLKVVTRLERKYAGFDGLNLTLETLEGLAKHNGPVRGRGTAGQMLLRRAIAAAGLAGRLHLDRFGPAEAQAAAIADDIAYNSHDIDDGLRAGFITIDDLRNVPLVGQHVRETPQPGDDQQRLIYQVNRRIITNLIDDVVRQSRGRLAALTRQSLQGVREASRPVVALSPERHAEIEGLQRFLLANVYRHPRVMRVVAGAQAVVRDLFGRYLSEPGAMPATWRTAAEASDSERERASVVADFVAGMTDRFAIKEHQRLFDATPELR